MVCFHSSGLQLSELDDDVIEGTTQVRTAHTDIQFPDFSDYRREPVKGATADQETTSANRKAFSYLLLAGLLFGSRITS